MYPQHPFLYQVKKQEKSVITKTQQFLVKIHKHISYMYICLNP